MISTKILAPIAALAALVVLPTAAAAPNGGPVAGAAGDGGGPLVYPSIVNVPFQRAEAALSRATEYADEAQPDKAIAQLAIVRVQLKKAWRGEKYLIDNAPPPVPGDALASGAPVSASPFASAEDSGAQLFTLYWEIASTSAAVIETSKGTLQSALSTTIFAALNQRDAAIKYIHDHQPPPPPPGDLQADASGAPVASGWSGTMGSAADLVGDEIDELDAMLAGTLSDGVKRVFRAAELQDTKTQKTIKTWWPPAPAGD